ncbi:unnamed protein product [Rangifer tarandus platyrhynchus]|uniref:Uncharacterized protein n=1 Tax=Rangifer tarandus platyrhynchus TaxID=3082113 RepID=A0ABN8Y9M0_RANTA|nr:unnamed protein product [Rangifer tarandus platyrhynchus]
MRPGEGGDGEGAPAGLLSRGGHSAEQADAQTRALALEVDRAAVCSAHSSRTRCGPRGRKRAFSVHRFLFQLVTTNPFESQPTGRAPAAPEPDFPKRLPADPAGAGLGRLDESAQPASFLSRPRRALALQPAVLGPLRGCWGLPTTSHPLEPPGAGQEQLQDGEGRLGGMVAQEAWDPTVMPLQLPAGPTPLTTASTVRTGSPAPGSTGAKPCAVLPVGIVSSSAAGMPAGRA